MPYHRELGSAILLRGGLGVALAGCVADDDIITVVEDQFGSTIVTVIAEADARVEEAHPGTNYGAWNLTADRDSGINDAEESYLRFAVTDLPVGAVVQSVALELSCINGNRNAPRVYRARTTSWSESAITWSNRPGRTGRALGDIGSHPGCTSAAPVRMRYEITSGVSGNGTYAFVLVPDSTNDIRLRSREDTGDEPRLVIAYTLNPTNSVIAGAGDIADDDSDDTATAALLDQINPAFVFTTGDNAYPDGTLSQYESYYAPTWGANGKKDRTRPSPGNHDYHVSGAAGYRDYFGSAVVANPQDGGLYYAWEVGDWALFSLNSEVAVSATSSQYRWLRDRLAATTKPCKMAYMHSNRYSSGFDASHDNDSSLRDLWQLLYDHEADLAVGGHQHSVERFAPQKPGDPINGNLLDQQRGIRQIVVGTGGRNLYGFGPIQANSIFRDSSNFGVLRLTLRESSYDWSFISVNNGTLDRGTVSCHNAGKTKVFVASADAHVDETTPSTNYATWNLHARAGSGQQREAYLKFELSGIPDGLIPIKRARIRLYTTGNGGGADGPRLYQVSSNSWSETGLTWSNRPGAGTLIADAGSAAGEQWIELDITSFLDGQASRNQTFSFVLRGDSARNFQTRSREDVERPRLVVNW